MRIAVGSTSRHKKVAVQKACSMMGWNSVEIIQYEAESAISRQPVELNWIMAGARNRALLTSEAVPDTPCVGIENGIMRSWNVHLDVAVIVVVMPNGEWHFGSSPGIQIPEHVVKKAQERGFDTTTMGDILAEQKSCDPADPHLTLTGGLLSRSDLLAQGIYAVFTQINW